MEYPHRKAILIDYKGDLTKRWYIEYYYWNNDTQKLVRKRFYRNFDKYKSLNKRREYAYTGVASINKVLPFMAVTNGKMEVKGMKKPVKKVENMTLKQAFEYIIEVKYTVENNKKTHFGFSSICAKFLDFCAITQNNPLLNDITKSDCQRYIDYLKITRKLTANTVLSHYSALSAIWNNLIKREAVILNPWIGVDKPSKQQSTSNIAFTEIEISRIKQLIVRSDERLWIIVQMIYYTYLRPIELARLKVKHIDLLNQRIFLPGSLSKNGKDYFLVIPKPLLKELETLKLESYPGEYFVFGSKGETCNVKIAQNWILNRHTPYLFDLNIIGKTLYSWKHTGVVQAYKNGVDIKAIQLQCRHYSIEQTDVYLKSLGFVENTPFLNGIPEI